jgi:hypothetical protein
MAAPYAVARLDNAEMVSILTAGHLSLPEEYGSNTSCSYEDYFWPILNWGRSLPNVVEKPLSPPWIGSEWQDWAWQLVGCAYIWQRILSEGGCPPGVLPGEVGARTSCEIARENYGIDGVVIAYLEGVPIKDLFA